MGIINKVGRTKAGLKRGSWLLRRRMRRNKVDILTLVTNIVDAGAADTENLISCVRSGAHAWHGPLNKRARVDIPHRHSGC